MRTGPSKRMMKRVDAGHQALAEARIHLRAVDKSADYSLKRVPDALLDDSGLMYERARWRRKKNRDEEAMLSFTKPQLEAEHAEQWWDERSILARRRLADGAITDAYRLAQRHGPLDGARLITAEWFAGWVARRDPPAAAGRRTPRRGRRRRCGPRWYRRAVR